MAVSSTPSPPPGISAGCCLTTSGQTLPGKVTVIHRITPVKGLVPKSKVIYATWICQDNRRGWQGRVNARQNIVTCKVL